MRPKNYAYLSGAVVAAIAFAIVGGNSLADGNSNGSRQPEFAVDASWPQPLPAPVGDDGKAHTWVQGEVASCSRFYSDSSRLLLSAQHES